MSKDYVIGIDLGGTKIYTAVVDLEGNIISEKTVATNVVEGEEAVLGRIMGTVDTVLKDVSYGPKNFGDKEEEAILKAKKALKLVGISEDLFDKSPFELSGGQKRRVAIAGIIALEPKILVLDEPTAGLDPKGAKDMMELFNVIHNNGTTIVMVTHEPDVAEYTKRIVTFKDGHKISDEIVEKLKQVIHTIKVIVI